MTGAAIAAVVATASAGTPPRVPDIALHSPLLFHLERVAALLAGFLVVLVVVARAWAGELPAELSTQGVRYSEFGKLASSAIDDLSDDLESLHADLAELGKRIERLEDRI